MSFMLIRKAHFFFAIAKNTTETLRTLRNTKNFRFEI